MIVWSIFIHFYTASPQFCSFWCGQNVNETEKRTHLIVILPNCIALGVATVIESRGKW